MDQSEQSLEQEYHKTNKVLGQLHMRFFGLRVDIAAWESRVTRE